MAHYTAGRYEEAIRELEKACALHPDPMLRFNLAQAHRKNGTFDAAAFYYAKYLEMAPSAANRSRAERWLRETERAAQERREKSTVTPARLDAAAAAPPLPAAPVAATYLPPPVPEPPPEPAPATVSAKIEPRPPVAVRLTAHAGVAVPLLMGRERYESEPLFSASASATHPIPLGEHSLELGVMGSYAPMSYPNDKTGVESSASFVGAHAIAGLRVPLGRAFTLEPSLGVGVVWWRGLRLGNPFTPPEHEATGAIAMPSARFALAGILRLSQSAYLGASASVDVSKTVGGGLQVSTVTRLGISGLLGVSL